MSEENGKVITDADLKPFPKHEIDVNDPSLTFVMEFPAPTGDLRDIVKNHMLKMAFVEWRPENDVVIGWEPGAEGDFRVELQYDKGKTYYGMTYAGSASCLDLFEQYLKDGVYAPPFNYYLEAVGNNCSTSIAMSYQQLIDFPVTGGYKPTSKRVGILTFPTKLNKPPYEKFGDNWITQDLFDLNSENDIYEAYAKLDRGDLIYKNKVGSGHTRMVSRVEVTRDGNGNIAPFNSFIYCIEQTNTWDKDRPGNVSTWFIDKKYGFDRLYVNKFMPVTLCVFHEENPVLRKAYVTFNGKNTGETLKDRMSGVIESNFVLNYVMARLADKDGNVVKEVLVHIKSAKYTFDVSELKDKLFDSVPSGTYVYSLRAGISRGGCDVERFEVKV